MNMMLPSGELRLSFRRCRFGLPAGHPRVRRCTVGPAQRSCNTKAKNGDPLRLFFAETPRARLEAIRIVDMTSSNAWAEFVSVFRRTCTAFVQHENAKAQLKALIPEDAREAIGHGVRAKRSKPLRSVSIGANGPSANTWYR
jgi:hypothetical protein